MTLRTNARVAGFTYWIYFAAGISGMALAGNKPATAVLALVGALSALMVAMAYWLWRIRVRKTLLGIVSISTPLVTGATK